MKKLVTIIVVFLLILLALPVVLRKRTVQLLLNGKADVTVTRPFVMPWSDNDFGVYAGGTRLFGVWGDAFDAPLFIYPFADKQRFLCIDDDDTCVLVFVVDFRSSSTKMLDSSGWPLDGYTRNYMASRSTNIVTDTIGYVRLPSFKEVQEMSDYLAKLTPEQFEAMSLPFADFGVYRLYWRKDTLLSELATNRESVWP